MLVNSHASNFREDEVRPPWPRPRGAFEVSDGQEVEKIEAEYQLDVKLDFCWWVCRPLFSRVIV